MARTPQLFFRTNSKPMANELTFDLSKASDIDAAKDDHMHSLAITFDGKDKMVQHWMRFEGGKKKEVVEIAYTRVN